MGNGRAQPGCAGHVEGERSVQPETVSAEPDGGNSALIQAAGRDDCGAGAPGISSPDDPKMRIPADLRVGLFAGRRDREE